jgi:hypothetical protein
MKRILSSLAILVFVSLANAGQVYINEVLPNPPGSDSTAASGNEFFELRGTPGLSLSNYCLISVEGQGTGVPGKGDINQLFDLGAFSLGANGYLFARQHGSLYTSTAEGATVIENATSQGWGQANAGGVGSTVGHYSDGTQVDMENSAATMLLVKVEGGITPTNTLDLDTNNDGFLDLPAGWTLVDSVGIMDGASALASDSSYGAITFRAPDSIGNYLGACAYGNIINVPGPLTTTSGTFYVGRKGESTGSTSNDWVGSIVDGTAANPVNYIFYSASDPSYTGMLIADMIYGGTNASAAPLGSLAYTPTINGTRFANYTHLPIGGPIGDVAVDPRDNTTILFTVDNDVGGGIYRAYKVASGNWWVDSTPVVKGLDRPSGMVVETNGTLWWVHDATMALMRLKAPWSANTPELVVTNFGSTVTDDDPSDLTIAPPNFSGTLGQPNWLVVADRGSDSDTYNALFLADPATSTLNQANNNFLVAATTSGLGWDNVNAIGSLPQSGEVVTLSQDGFITAVDGNGALRAINHSSVAITAGQALAVDPTTGRVWVADDVLDEVWSVDPSPSGQTADIKELSFPLKEGSPAYRQINFHDPGMAFAPNGAFVVVSDTSTAGGGGRLLIFHQEAYAPFSLSAFSFTNTSQTVQGPQFQWAPAGNASFNLKYDVQRGTNIANLASFVTVAANLAATSFTDTNAPAGAAFYRVIAKP